MEQAPTLVSKSSFGVSESLVSHVQATYERGYARFVAEHRTLLTASSIVADLQYFDTDR